MELVHTLQELPPYVFAELDRLKAEARARGLNITDLGIGSPDIPVAAEIIEALGAATRDRASFGYPPFRGVPAFFDSIERFMHSRFGVSISAPTEAIALSGAKEGLAQLIMATCNPGDTVLVPSIYYPVYARSAWLCGAKVEWIPMKAENEFLLDFDAIPREVADAARVMIMNYPNNPTGATADLAFLSRAVDFARKHSIILVSDLAYSELTFGSAKAHSVHEVEGARDVAVEFHSFSKNFSMAGFRLGYAVGGADAINALAAYRSNVGYGTPTALQHAGAFALDNYTSLVPPKVAQYKSRRDAVVRAFQDAGWNITVPQGAMYIWAKIPAGFSDWSFVKTLLFEHGIVVTPGVAFGEGGTGYFRISLVRDEATLSTAAATIAGLKTAS